MNVTIGVDIGQRVDPTAICVTEQVWRKVTQDLPGAKDYEDHYIVRHLERLMLGTSYPEIRDRLVNLIRKVEDLVRMGNLENRAGSIVPTEVAFMKVYMDATGVGKPVVDMMSEAGVKVVGCYFKYGDRRVEEQDLGTGELKVSLGKAYMVSRLQALLQTRRLHLPRTDEATALTQELIDFEIRVDTNANEKYGAFRVGAHDDLVTALGLTTQDIPAYLGGMASYGVGSAFPIPEWAGGTARTIEDALGVSATIHDLQKYGGMGLGKSGLNGLVGQDERSNYENRPRRDRWR